MHEDQYKFLIISLSKILKMRNISEKRVEKIITHILYSVPFSKIMPFVRCGKIH
jgi:hypothetical protein